jgi:hypothetical protein
MIELEESQEKLFVLELPPTDKLVLKPLKKIIRPWEGDIIKNILRSSFITIYQAKAPYTRGDC